MASQYMVGDICGNWAHSWCNLYAMAVSPGDVWTSCQCRGSVHGAYAVARIWNFSAFDNFGVVFWGISNGIARCHRSVHSTHPGRFDSEWRSAIGGAISAVLICILGNSDGF